MDTLQAIILGIVQGFTEFLPVSSSGHLVVFQKLLGIEQHDLAFDVAAHLGTLVAVFTVYRKSLLNISKELIFYPKTRKLNNEIWLFVVVIAASIPTAIIGLSFKDTFEGLFSNIQAVSVFFIVTGVILYFTDKIQAVSKNTDFNNLEGVKKISIKTAALIGVAQAMAIAPGISRAGSTIAAGLYLKLDRQTAALFSFMISIPAVLGAGVLQLRDLTDYSAETLKALGIGFVTSYLAGLVGLLGLLYLVGKGRLRYFSYYLWVLGASLLIYHFI